MLCTILHVAGVGSSIFGGREDIRRRAHPTRCQHFSVAKDGERETLTRRCEGARWRECARRGAVQLGQREHMSI